MKKYSPEWWAALPPEKVGKETEKLVEDVFKAWNRRQTFAWHRMPDARAARGALAAQPGDYLYRDGEASGFIEVKALKHPYRLPSDRLSQHGVLNKWSLAGAINLVLIHHYLTGEWRVADVDDLAFGVPSWDLRPFATYSTAREALLATGYFEDC